MNVDVESHVLTATGPQTIREAAQTHAELLAGLRQPGNVALDCAEVTEVDLSFIQMILAAHRSAGDAGRKFTLRDRPQGALHDALVRGGFVRVDDPHPPTDPAFWCRGGAPG